MLTKLTIRNFKKFDKVEIELGNPVVFIGPNNSGKTTALQAIALWHTGLKRWIERRSGKGTPQKRPGVTLNRRDLIAVPVPNANLLWRDLHYSDVKEGPPKRQTHKIHIEIEVEGVHDGRVWSCGFEFDHANPESFYCRPLNKMEIPTECQRTRVALLPPMSGLLANEIRLDPGAIDVRIGEGRTAEVLRNICHQIATIEGGVERWNRLSDRIKKLFGITLDEPAYISERGEIAMTYRDAAGIRLDLSSSGRGLQQTLLVLAYLAANPGSVLLIDEPDAHLEILRQRQIYQLLVEEARQQQSQIIAASHSEVLLNEAADRDVVVAFVGRTPHRLDDRGFQVQTSLRDIGFEDYYQAEQTGWVLYLEGSTDLEILRTLAEALNHPARQILERPFVHYLSSNQTQRAYEHFYGLREAKRDLVGFALFDRLSTPLQAKAGLEQYTWSRREIENYICDPDGLLAYAEASAQEASLGPLFEQGIRERRRKVMQECIDDFVPRAALRSKSDKWWVDTKASDAFLDRLFEAFFQKLTLPNLMRKTDYHVLARHLPTDRIDPEIKTVLDRIVELQSRAKPAK